MSRSIAVGVVLGGLGLVADTAIEHPPKETGQAAVVLTAPVTSPHIAQQQQQEQPTGDPGFEYYAIHDMK